MCMQGGARAGMQGCARAGTRVSQTERWLPCLLTLSSSRRSCASASAQSPRYSTRGTISPGNLRFSAGGLSLGILGFRVSHRVSGCSTAAGPGTLCCAAEKARESSSRAPLCGVVACGRAAQERVRLLECVKPAAGARCALSSRDLHLQAGSLCGSALRRGRPGAGTAGAPLAEDRQRLGVAVARQERHHRVVLLQARAAVHHHRLVPPAVLGPGQVVGVLTVVLRSPLCVKTGTCG